MNSLNYNSELYHHGILGMKWGVRRYRNEDGSLTPLGKKRQYSDDYLNTKEHKSTKQMSNKELKARTERINAENNYRKAQNERSVGRRFISGVSQSLRNTAITAVSTALLAAGVTFLAPKLNMQSVDGLKKNIEQNTIQKAKAARKAYDQLIYKNNQKQKSVNKNNIINFSAYNKNR